MAEADAQHGDSAGSPADDRRGHAGVLGSTGSRADEHCVGLQGLDLVDGDCIVAVDLRVGTQLAEVLDEVVDERVVVVDDQNPGAHPATLANAARRAVGESPWTTRVSHPLPYPPGHVEQRGH